MSCPVFSLPWLRYTLVSLYSTRRCLIVNMQNQKKTAGTQRKLLLSPRSSGRRWCSQSAFLSY